MADPRDQALLTSHHYTVLYHSPCYSFYVCVNIYTYSQEPHFLGLLLAFLSFSIILQEAEQLDGLYTLNFSHLICFSVYRCKISGKPGYHAVKILTADRRRSSEIDAAHRHLRFVRNTLFFHLSYLASHIHSFSFLPFFFFFDPSFLYQIATIRLSDLGNLFLRGSGVRSYSNRVREFTSMTCYSPD